MDELHFIKDKEAFSSFLKYSFHYKTILFSMKKVNFKDLI